MMNEFSVREAFNKSCKNFESTSIIFDDGLDPQNMINLYGYLIPAEHPETKISELHLHFATTTQQIMFDFIKAIINLCEGHLADHYFYKRRSVEYIQLYAFIASSSSPRELFREYLETHSTSDFKRDKKFKRWFNEEKTILKSKFPNLIQAYDNACKYGTHAGLSNQQISQHWVKVPEGFIGIVNYFDIASGVFEKNPFETAMIQLFRTYNDIFVAIFHYKLTPYPFPEYLYEIFSNQFNPYFDNHRENLRINYPHLYGETQ